MRRHVASWLSIPAPRTYFVADFHEKNSVWMFALDFNKPVVRAEWNEINSSPVYPALAHLCLDVPFGSHVLHWTLSMTKVDRPLFIIVFDQYLAISALKEHCTHRAQSREKLNHDESVVCFLTFYHPLRVLRFLPR